MVNFTSLCKFFILIGATIVSANPTFKSTSSGRIAPVAGDQDVVMPMNAAVCSDIDMWTSMTSEERQSCIDTSMSSGSFIDDDMSDMCSVGIDPISGEYKTELENVIMENNPEKTDKFVAKLAKKMSDPKLDEQIQAIDRDTLKKHKKTKKSIIAKLFRFIKKRRQAAKLTKRSPEVKAIMNLEKKLSPLQTILGNVISKIVANKNIREFIISEAADSDSLLRQLFEEEDAKKIADSLKHMDEHGALVKRDFFLALLLSFGAVMALCFIMVCVPLALGIFCSALCSCFGHH